MAVPRARAWALALSVPVVFALVAVLLSAIPLASASPLAASALSAAPAAAGQSAGGHPTAGGVVRSLVRPSAAPVPVAWRLRPQNHGHRAQCGAHGAAS